MQAASAFSGARAVVWLRRRRVAACFPAERSAGLGPAFHTLSSQRTAASLRPLPPSPLLQCHRRERDAYASDCAQRSRQGCGLQKQSAHSDRTTGRPRGRETDWGRRHSRTRAQRHDPGTETRPPRCTKPVEKSECPFLEGNVYVCVCA